MATDTWRGIVRPCHPRCSSTLARLPLASGSPSCQGRPINQKFDLPYGQGSSQYFRSMSLYRYAAPRLERYLVGQSLRPLAKLKEVARVLAAPFRQVGV
jgi:hypothetical protein